VIPDQVFALDEIPLQVNGIVNFVTLGTLAEQLCSSKAQAEEGFGCPYCDVSFKSPNLAQDHLLYHTGPFFICSVPECRANVGKIRMTRRRMYYHTQEHEKRGDLRGLTGPHSSVPDAEEYWKRTPQEIQEHIAQLLAQEVHVGLVPDDARRTLFPKESGGRTNGFFMALRQQAAALVEAENARPTEISEKTQAQLLLYNRSQIEKGKF
jgi:hypothetical protein